MESMGSAKMLPNDVFESPLWRNRLDWPNDTDAPIPIPYRRSRWVPSVFLARAIERMASACHSEGKTPSGLGWAALILVDRTIGGDVRAFARQKVGGAFNNGPLVESLDFRRRYGELGRLLATCTMEGSRDGDFWLYVETAGLDSLIDRVKREAPMSAEVEAPSVDSWRVRPAERQCNWILRDAVLDEARAQATKPGNAELARVLSRMAAPERSWKAETIASAMRKTGQFKR